VYLVPSRRTLLTGVLDLALPRICLVCGQVGCCDASKNTHATKHHKETGHAVIQSYQPGESWRYCYVDHVMLPEALNAPIDCFLKTYRPRFKYAHHHDHLWLSRNGGPLGPDGLCRAIARRTGEALGIRLYPNTFRACAATSIAQEIPTNIRAASRLLGHTSVSITERHYNRAETIDGSRRYQQHLDALRERLGCDR